MSRKQGFVRRAAGAAAVVVLVVTAISCGGNKKDGPDAASMEQLYAENGSPVNVRELKLEDFSVYLKYPAVLSAASESTAHAQVSDVVRKINAKIGSQVKQDEVIVSFSEDNQNLTQAKAVFENAQKAFNRSSALFTNGDISRQDFESERMRYEIARANLNAASDMIHVKAPISGTVTRINVRLTENVRPGTPLFTVSNENGFEVRFYVGANEIDRILTGARAFIGDPADNLEGRVTQVSLVMDSAKQSFPVTAFFNVNSRKLISGMGIDLAVETYRNEKAIVLSRREMMKTDSGWTAFLAVADKAQPVTVKIGHDQGLRYEIEAGLEEGDILVCEGSHRLSPGMPVNVVSLPEAGDTDNVTRISQIR